MNLRVLIVDDEPLARQRLVELLRGESDVEIVGECDNGDSALEALGTFSPDLAFLDIRMPEKDGFQVAESLGPGRRCEIVFVTAYDQFALRAFKVHALDYLLKPVEQGALDMVLRRVRSRASHEDSSLAQRILDAMQELTPKPGPARPILIRSGNEVLLLKADDIDWVESAGSHVCFHVGNKSHIARGTLSQVEQDLQERGFVRIHRSTIVNADRVRKLMTGKFGEHKLELNDGSVHAIGREYRDVLLKGLGRT